MDFANAGQLLDGTNYEEWSCRMEITLRATGIDVWKSVTTGYIAPKKVKTMTQKGARKNNSMAMELILEGLTYSMKRKIGNYSSAKELWVSLEQLCSKGDTKDNSNSENKSSSKDYGSNDDTISSFENHEDDEEEGTVDLATALDEIILLHKLIRKQAKKIYCLQSQLEETKSKEEKEIQDDENEDVKADLEVALLEICTLSEFIKKQNMESSLQLEEIKNKEADLLKSLQDKEKELAKAKEEIVKSQKLVEISSWNPAHNTDKPITNEAEELVQLEYAFITALEEINNGQTNDWNIGVSKESIDNLKDTIMSIIRHSKTIQKKYTLLQESNGKHDETVTTPLGAVGTKGEENMKLKAKIADLTEVQEDLRETVMNLKVQIEEAKRAEEVLKNQLVEKEGSYLKMEMEIMDLRKNTTHNKIINSSTILNEILDSQKTSRDKSGLGYNRMKEASGSGKRTSDYKYDMTPFFVKEKGEELT